MHTVRKNENKLVLRERFYVSNEGSIGWSINEHQLFSDEETAINIIAIPIYSHRNMWEKSLAKQ